MTKGPKKFKIFLLFFLAQNPSIRKKSKQNVSGICKEFLMKNTFLKIHKFWGMDPNFQKELKKNPSFKYSIAPYFEVSNNQFDVTFQHLSEVCPSFVRG